MKADFEIGLEKAIEALERERQRKADTLRQLREEYPKYPLFHATKPSVLICQEKMAEMHFRIIKELQYLGSPKIEIRVVDADWLPNASSVLMEKSAFDFIPPAVKEGR